ncbi:hypothetical protein GCM10027614_29650 [Micromonospora vulcania]
MVGDLLGSLGVIGAALLIEVTDWWWADAAVAVAIGVFILPRTWRLGRAAVRILVQAAPEHLQVTAVHDRLAAVPGVVEVHDLHVWTLTSGMEVASAHLTMAPDAEVGAVLTAARTALHDDFRIEHATLQIEPGAAPAPAARSSGSGEFIVTTHAPSVTSAASTPPAPVSSVPASTKRRPPGAGGGRRLIARAGEPGNHVPGVHPRQR